MATRTEKYESSLQSMQYFTVLARLFRRVPGPVALVWGLATAGQLALTMVLLRQGGEALLAGSLPQAAAAVDARVVATILLGMWVLEAIKKGLYRSLLKFGRPEAQQERLLQTVQSAVSRIGRVMAAQFLVGAIIIGFSITAAVLGATMAFIPLYLLSFTLAPAIYFAATRGYSGGRAIGAAVQMARKHWRYVLGVPALFLCISPLIDVPGLEATLTEIAAGDKLAIGRAVFFYMLFHYAQWLGVSAVYVAADAEDSA